MLKSIGVKQIADLFNDVPAKVPLSQIRSSPLPSPKWKPWPSSRNMPHPTNLWMTWSVFWVPAPTIITFPPLWIVCSAAVSFPLLTLPINPRFPRAHCKPIFEFQTLIANLTGMEVATPRIMTARPPPLKPV